MEPLSSPPDVLLKRPADLQPLVEEAAATRIVCIGDSTHGSSEQYAIRNLIARHLIEAHGFDFICFEADWPVCVELTRYVLNADGCARSASEALASTCKRWPLHWMLNNAEMEHFLEWLRRYNDAHPDRQVGFYGLDVYSMGDSMAAIARFLDERRDSGDVPRRIREAVMEALGCLEGLSDDPQRYSRAIRYSSHSCEAAVAAMLTGIFEERLHHPRGGIPFDIEQEAWVVRGAESYYRNLATGEKIPWNERDTHMFDTLERLLTLHEQRLGRPAKCICALHNTHVGLSRYTSMALRGRFNIGQLIRDRYGLPGSFIIGFSTYEGTVVAAEQWDAKSKVMTIPKPVQNSWEQIIHEACDKDRVIFCGHRYFRRPRALSPRTQVLSPLQLAGGSEERSKYDHWRGLRAVGVVFHPESAAANFVKTNLAGRFDALVFLRWSKAVTPLSKKPSHDDVREGVLPEFWPYGE